MWGLVDAPKGIKLIRLDGCTRSSTTQSDGSVNWYKAWLVEKTYAQQHVIDYNEMFVTVAKMTIVRVLIAVVATKGWHLYQMDVKNMFLQGAPEEWMYMVQPPGFQSSLNTLVVCRMKKSLYGLKQAPHACNMKLKQCLRWMGFVTSKSDSSLDNPLMED